MSIRAGGLLERRARVGEHSRLRSNPVYNPVYLLYWYGGSYLAGSLLKRRARVEEHSPEEVLCRQFLYFCTSKASKLRGALASGRRPTHATLLAQTSARALLYIQRYIHTYIHMG